MKSEDISVGDRVVFMAFNRLSLIGTVKDKGWFGGVRILVEHGQEYAGKEISTNVSTIMKKA